MTTIKNFILFIAIFLSLYSLLHVFFYIKLKKIDFINHSNRLYIAIFLLIMTLSPIITRIIIKNNTSTFSQTIALICYIWMTFVFLFFAFYLLLDLYNFFVYLLSLIFPKFLLFKLKSKLSFAITICSISFVIIYGFFEANSINIKRIVIPTKKILNGYKCLRIVQISDTHFSIISGINNAKKIVKIIKNNHPDILVATGDFIDKGAQDENKIADLFKSIDTPLGKYSIFGNHEFYYGIRNATLFMKKAGFKVLRNENITIDKFINITGIDDPASARHNIYDFTKEEYLLKKNYDKKLTILLKHRPLINKASIDYFDIQLSGHTHNGQIFPFRLISKIFFPYINGLYQIGKNSKLYVTSGTGTWGPPIRFLAPPEITIIDFCNK